MKRFVFKDKTIAEARAELLKDIGEKYLLRNREQVTIKQVGELEETDFSYTDFSQTRQLKDSTIDPDSVTKYKKHFGFKVTVSIEKPNGSERWDEWITVPVKLNNSKCWVKCNYERSLLH